MRTTSTGWRPRRVAAALGLGLAFTGLLATAAPATAARTATDPSVVNTTHGKVRGTVSPGLRTFEGIPYAAPPVDELRWTSPQPATAWTGVRDATAPGPACAQPVGLAIGVPSNNEDCLYLNVTAPTKTKAKAKAKQPVIVWIHGGSMMYGTGDMYGPDRLAAEGAVVVSMNYRLGVFSFLTDRVLDGPKATYGSGSFGLEDQQAALRWVRENIAAFGGDPRNVTIMGQSGGGYAVCDHLASPVSAGLFNRAIIQSAACATDGSSSRTRAEAEADSDDVIKLDECADASDLPACLRTVDVEVLLAKYGQWEDGELKEPRPVTGTKLLPLSPAEAIRTGRFNRVPVLVGVNHDEENGMVGAQELAPDGAPMAPEAYEPAIRAQFGTDADAVLRQYPLHRFGSAGEALAAVKTDAKWSTPTLDTARLLSRWTTTRMYEFAEKDTPWFEGMDYPSFPMNAQHMAELAYLFDLDLFQDLTDEQAKLRTRMISTWVRFAAVGNPNGGGERAWPQFRGETPSGWYVQSLTAGPWQSTAFAQDHGYSFWKSLAA
ncbi:carboxylesterase family protein [Micromonospora polyrhachis]|uniref:Carboxylic ester hydrolase n=1 Tax=Micromonospora polyrhachis TaxID=1282883 RepID=A0A7W7SSH9_9ACTN|nr:carboxylesterase family protein [Micromonospora polyrhachis]MBB4960160.1 para-nitrobenzyl esterase [Micromonospora polyrhachis]